MLPERETSRLGGCSLCDIQQILDLHLTETFTYDLIVWDVKSSRNGKCLAVALSVEKHAYMT